jgi:hypothetical protein
VPRAIATRTALERTKENRIMNVDIQRILWMSKTAFEHTALGSFSFLLSRRHRKYQELRTGSLFVCVSCQVGEPDLNAKENRRNHKGRPAVPHTLRRSIRTSRQNLFSSPTNTRETGEQQHHLLLLYHVQEIQRK